MIALALWWTLQTAAGAPDQIYVNGNVFTVDDTFSVVEAIAVHGDRILARGSNDEVRALAVTETEVIDLGGRTVLPGLIDNHNHFIRATEHWLYEARLDRVPTREEAPAVLKAKADSLEGEDWLFSLGGWFEDQFEGDQRGFTLEDLDRVAPENPAFVQHSTTTLS